jgi:phosphatidate cytidylyltransferase
MLRTRLWMGAILIALVTSVLVFDQQFEPWYPFLLVFVLVLAVVGTVELVGIIDEERRPPLWLCLAGVVGVLLANWPAHLGQPPSWIAATYAFAGVAGAFAALVLAAFLTEMATFRAPGNSVNRIALTIFIVAYLALLPSFLAQMRWLPPLPGDAPQTPRGVGAIVLAIFVPKLCDVGAYFSGRLFGKHKMSPLLSPKKTWEGFTGGIGAALLTAFLLNRLVPALREDWVALAFGTTVGVLGVLGDLAESLIKRDCQKKDASQVVPGFGGVLDVVDSIVFTAPVAYAWCCV